MKDLRVTLAWIVAAAAALAGPSARADEEVLRFTQPQLDLGAISDSQSVLHAFPFVNVSKRTVRLDMTYCHFCSVPILSKTRLEPGESGTLVLELVTANLRGPVQASATVQEEGRPDTHVTVEMKAEVCPRVWVEPRAMFPVIKRGEGATGEFSVLGRISGFKVIKVESEPPLDGVEFGPVVPIEDCGSKAYRQSVTVRFPKDAPLGPFVARMTVLTSDDDAGPKLVSVDGKAVGRVRFEPTVLGAILGMAAPFRQPFELVADDGPVILHSIEVLKRDECAGLVLDAMPGAVPGRVRVVVSGYAPPRARQSVDVRLRAVVSTLLSGELETLEVPVTLMVRGTN